MLLVEKHFSCCLFFNVSSIKKVFVQLKQIRIEYYISQQSEDLEKILISYGALFCNIPHGK